MAQDAAGKGARATGNRAKSKSMDGGQEAVAGTPPAPESSAQPQSSSTAGPDAAAIVSHPSCLLISQHSSPGLLSLVIFAKVLAQLQIAAD